jgi:methylated-DNA-[protein]-cysteine S-methyltransferase
VKRATITVWLPPGPCALAASEEGLTALRLGETVEQAGGGRELAVAREAQRQLEAYFSGVLQIFDVPLDLSGRTDFQLRVLRACSQVPYGFVATYGELAKRVGHPGAARAVAQVMAHNALPLVIPCHRVVGSGGRLTGYGPGLGLKARLLEMERRGSGWAQTAPEGV